MPLHCCPPACAALRTLASADARQVLNGNLKNQDMHLSLRRHPWCVDKYVRRKCINGIQEEGLQKAAPVCIRRPPQKGAVTCLETPRVTTAGGLQISLKSLVWQFPVQLSCSQVDVQEDTCVTETGDGYPTRNRVNAFPMESVPHSVPCRPCSQGALLHAYSTFDSWRLAAICSLRFNVVEHFYRPCWLARHFRPPTASSASPYGPQLL